MQSPYTVDAERELLVRERIEVVLTKDSGGQYTAAKLTAAADLGVEVVVVKRPPVPTGVRLLTDLATVRAVVGDHLHA